VAADPRSHLPLKDLTFRILVALGDGELHGWGLVQALSDSGAPARVLPGHLYRTLDSMLEAGLLHEDRESAAASPARPTRGATPHRFFSLTRLGRAVARAETDRLDALVTTSRSRRLLKGRVS
jgi:DNA-binding PadR family transcriptional regulator